MSEKNVVTKNPIRAKVVSLSKDLKTVKVEIPRVVPAKMYGKRLHMHTCLFADTNQVSDLAVGKKVDVLPCRRISKSKSWKVVAVVS